MNEELHQLSLKQLADGLREKKFSSKELTECYLSRIAEYNNTLNTFITVTNDQALTAAAEADKRIASGDAKPLTGIPIAQKDIFCTQGVKTTCGSKMLDNFIAPYNATTVQQFNDTGMVLLGKTNRDEFAMGSSNENSFYGAVHNPWALDCVPGGS